MGKELATQVQEGQRVPCRKDPGRSTLRHVVIGLAKIEDKGGLLRAAGEGRQMACRGTPIRLAADFLAETLQATGELHDILKVMKGKNLKPRLLYPARISYRFDG